MKMHGCALEQGAWRWFRRYAQFCAVGSSGVVVDMGVLWILADASTLDWNLTASKVIAAEAAIVNNFFWNDTWTFRGRRAGVNIGSCRFLRLGKFNLICAAGIFLSVVLLTVQVHRLHFNLYLANITSIIAVSLWNFVLSWQLGWRELAANGG